LSRIGLLALVCCVSSCSKDNVSVQQSRPTTGIDSTAPNDEASFTGVCPGLPTIGAWAQTPDAPDSAQQVFLVSPTRFGDTESSLSRCLGAPIEVTVDTVANLHTGEPDNVLRIAYPGILYSIYRVLADGKEILFKVEAFGPTEELALGISVGVPWSHVLEQLGVPTGEEQSAAGGFVAHYVVDEFVEETVTFWVEGGVVSRISWDYYID
jgi:hypothetical protein